MFEWDEDKRQQNLKKHGVDFIRVAMIFDNPIITEIDGRRHGSETRYRVLGHIQNEYYIVVFTWRGKTRRLISAWKAGNNGKARYQAILSGRA